MFGTWESVSYCSLNFSGLEPNCPDANEDRKARAFLVRLLYLVPVFHSWTNHTLQWVEIQIWFIEYITLQMLLQLAKRNHLGPSCNHNDLPHVDVDGELWSLRSCPTFCVHYMQKPFVAFLGTWHCATPKLVDEKAIFQCSRGWTKRSISKFFCHFPQVFECTPLCVRNFNSRTYPDVGVVLELKLEVVIEHHVKDERELPFAIASYHWHTW